ncbi:MAG: energy transducer TonB [Burkholderiales bacterium]|nr:energy transducer TonB [Burkholderiales bacterium]
MAIGFTPPPPLGAGPAFSAGRLRGLVAVALAIALHAALLMPSRPTLNGSALTEAAPAMVVRLLTREVVVPAAPLVQPEAAAVPVPETVPPMPAPTSARAPAKAAPEAATVPAPAPTPPAAPGLPPAPDYFLGGQLDPGPRLLEDVYPLYPEEAKQQEGSVVLRLLISEAGTVDNVAVVRAFPAGLFERSALEAWAVAKFSPGRMLGVAVKSQTTIEVMFTEINRGKVSGRGY